MLKNMSRLECKVGERVYQVTCDIDAPLMDIKEALFQFQKYIGYVEDQIKIQQENAKKNAETTAASEEVKEEPKIETGV